MIWRYLLLAALFFCQACLSPDGDGEASVNPEDFVVKGNGDAFEGKVVSAPQRCKERGASVQNGAPFESDGFFQFLDDCEPMKKEEKKAIALGRHKQLATKPSTPKKAYIEQVAGQPLVDASVKVAEPDLGTIGAFSGRPIGDFLKDRWADSPFMAEEALSQKKKQGPKIAEWIAKAGFHHKDLCLEDRERLSPAEFERKCNEWKVNRAIAICRSPISADPANPMAADCRDFLKDVAIYQDLAKQEESETKLQELVGLEAQVSQDESDIGLGF